MSPGNQCVERLPMAVDTTKVIFPKRELTGKKKKTVKMYSLKTFDSR